MLFTMCNIVGDCVKGLFGKVYVYIFGYNFASLKKEGMSFFWNFRIVI